MTNKKWFLNFNNQVTGPMTSSEIEKKLVSQPDAQVWGRGFTEWVDANLWRSKLVAPAPAVDLTHDTLWKFRDDGQESPAMKIEELIQALKNHPRVNSVDIWSSESKRWREIYAIELVADRMGLSRRAHPRVPMMGTYVGEGPQGPFHHNVVTISQGGMALGECKTLKIGDRLKGVLSSPNLLIHINCSCEVVYVGEGGYIGLKFLALPMEAESIVIEYVRKFTDSI